MDCLVTRLKATVADNNLTRLNMLKLTKKLETSPNASTQYITIASTSEVKLEALNGAEFYASNYLSDKIGNEVSILGEDTAWITNGGAMLLKNVYGINKLVVGGVSSLNFVELGQFHALKYLQLKGSDASVGNLSDFTHGLPTTMDLFQMTLFSNLKGSFEDLAHIAIKEINISSCAAIGGDISSVNVSNLQTLNVSNSGIQGSIESLVAKMIASGRTSGTLALPYIRYASGITYNGSPLSSQTSLPTASGNTAITWAADGTITWKG